MQGPGQSWIFLGYDVEGGLNDAGADAKICENYLRFYVYIRNNRWHPGSAPGPIVTAVFFIFKHC